MAVDPDVRADRASAPASAPPAVVDAGPGDAAQVAACPEGYDDRENAGDRFPRTFHLRAADDRVCDLKERIVIVGDKTVTVLARPQLTRTRAPIERRAKLDDRCGGPGGGHAGCSITFKRFWSAALGAGHVEFGNNMGNLVAEDDDMTRAESCREDSSYGVVATCSTAQHFVLVKYRAVELGGRPCWHLEASVWDGPAEQGTQIGGDVDRAASVNNHLVLRFPAAADADRAITLGFDGRAGTATLEIAGRRERCVAFRAGTTP